MYMLDCNDYYLNMFACIHRLEYEFNLVDPDMSVPLAGAYLPLVVDSFEWESPDWHSHLGTPLDVSKSYPPVQGRLKDHSGFWLNEFETIVSQGYRLPFIKLPHPVCLMNHKSACENSAFVSSAIEELTAGRCVIQSTTCPTVSSPLSVVFNAKENSRLVVDLRYVC